MPQVCYHYINIALMWPFSELLSFPICLLNPNSNFGNTIAATLYAREHLILKCDFQNSCSNLDGPEHNNMEEGSRQKGNKYHCLCPFSVNILGSPPGMF